MFGEFLDSEDGSRRLLLLRLVGRERHHAGLEGEVETFERSPGHLKLNKKMDPSYRSLDAAHAGSQRDSDMKLRFYSHLTCRMP